MKDKEFEAWINGLALKYARKWAKEKGEKVTKKHIENAVYSVKVAIIEEAKEMGLLQEEEV